MTSFTRLSLLLMCFIYFGCEQFNTNKNNASSNQVIDNSVKDIALLDNEFLLTFNFFNPEIETIYLLKPENNTLVTVDSTNISKQFTIKGITETPLHYAIKTNTSDQIFKFLVDASSIDLFINDNIKNSSTYSTSKIQKDYREYTTAIEDFKTQGVALYYDMRGDFSAKKIKDLKQKRRQLFSKQNEFTTNFIKAHPDSDFSALTIKNRLKTHGVKANRTLYNQLSDNIKSLPVGKHIDSFLTVKENEKKIIIVENKSETPKESTPKATEEYRPKAYSFSGQSPYGETYSLNSIPRGKVVLLDFWASWCGPCRATNPDLVALYNKYNSQGLEIMSISEDKGQAEWISAIHTDNLSWDYHVFDKNKSIAFRYGVESIPFKLLIDKKGRIASGKISGRSLENRIKELLAE